MPTKKLAENLEHYRKLVAFLRSQLDQYTPAPSDTDAVPAAICSSILELAEEVYVLARDTKAMSLGSIVRSQLELALRYLEFAEKPDATLANMKFETYDNLSEAYRLLADYATDTERLQNQRDQTLRTRDEIRTQEMKHRRTPCKLKFGEAMQRHFKGFEWMYVVLSADAHGMLLALHKRHFPPIGEFKEYVNKKEKDEPEVSFLVSMSALFMATVAQKAIATSMRGDEGARIADEADRLFRPLKLASE